MRGLAYLLAAAGILAKAMAADKAVFAHYMVGYSALCETISRD